jgi:poly-gamma-glutamate synthesis protein (capsule biosynthesis protein)
MEVRDTTVALTGNTFLAQTVSRSTNPRFLEAVEILRKADVALCNMECSIPTLGEDPPSFVAGQGWAATYMIGRPEMLDDLKFLGIDGVCAANNHISDFGDKGILSTIGRLREAGFPYAGIGKSLSEASAPMYIDSPSGLRVAVIMACDWGPRGGMGVNFSWPSGYLPSDDHAPFTPRPGVNLVRYATVSHVTKDELEALRKISVGQNWEDDKIARRYGFKRSHPLVGPVTNIGVEEDSKNEFWFLGRKFVADGKTGQSTEICKADLDRICTQVQEARRQADIVCVGLHDQSHGDEAHDFIKELAYASIDAGADVYFNNGGRLLGIEVYKGKAIIYGIASFFLQTEAVTRVPQSEMERFNLPSSSTAAEFLDAREQAKTAAFNASVGGKDRIPEMVTPTIHSLVFDPSGTLKQIKIHPLEGYGGTVMHTTDVHVPRFRRGLPLMPKADSPIRQAVFDKVVEESRQFGTEFELRDGVVVANVN